MNHEVELKLSLPPAALAALRRHPRVAAAPRAAPTATLTNTYYDTPEQALAGNKVALRTRKQGRRWVQTVKGHAPAVGGLSQRPEWEQPFLGAFDFGAIDDPAIRSLLERHADRLVPLFTTDFRRETRRLTPTEGIEILLMIDRGTIKAREREESISEIELELVSGQPQDLFAVAIELAEDLPLRPENRGKAERGLRLFRDELPGPVRSAPSPLTSGQTPLQAFRAIAADCMAQWQDNAAGAERDHDPEFVHQMRVALRRLRSGFKLFAPALLPDWVARWSAELASAAAELGDARDIDVLHEELLAPVLAWEGCPPEVRRLAAVVLDLRRKARTRVMGAFAKGSHGRRMLALEADLAALQGDALDAAADLVTFARLQLDHLLRRLRRRLRRALDGDATAMHELRIAAKRLRYALEFFAPLFPTRPTARYLGALAGLQNQLGYLNDISVGIERLSGWSKNDEQLHRATAFVAGWHAATARKVLSKVVPAAQALVKHKPPWNDVRARGPT